MKDLLNYAFLPDELPPGFQLSNGPDDVSSEVRDDDLKNLKYVQAYRFDYSIYRRASLHLFAYDLYSEKDLESLAINLTGTGDRAINLFGFRKSKVLIWIVLKQQTDTINEMTLRGFSGFQRYRERLGFEELDLADLKREHDAQLDPFGIAVETLTKQRALMFGFSDSVATNFHHRGVIVNYVLPDSPAYMVGLEKNHLIDTIFRGSYEYHIFSKSDYDKAVTDIINRNATEIKIRCWQFPENFDGNINYNRHLKEVMIQLGTSETEEIRKRRRAAGSGGGIEGISPEEMIWAKCNNPACKAEYQTSKKGYFKYVEEHANPMAPSAPPMVCEKCGEQSVFRAEKCMNPDCGIVFFRGSVPNDFPDRCPKCKQSATEESRKARKKKRK